MSYQSTYTIDTELQLRDAASVTASRRSQVSAANKIIDLGAGEVWGVILLDMTTIDFTTGDEVYNILAQVSNSATMASGVRNASGIIFGDAANGANDDTTVSERRELPFTNRIGTTVYRYLSLYEVLSGTTPILDFKAWLAKRP